MSKLLKLFPVIGALFMTSCHLQINEDQTPISVPQITAKAGDKKVEARLEWATGARLDFDFYEGPDWEITSEYKPELESILYQDVSGMSPKRIDITFKEPLKAGEISGELSFHYQNWESGAAGNKSGTLTIKVA
ncbi:MAG: hypothetical protein MJ208_02650 [Bacilli bacterium]|nr:hypothetical protein [Bacilli bacterium]